MASFLIEGVLIIAFVVGLYFAGIERGHGQRACAVFLSRIKGLTDLGRVL